MFCGPEVRADGADREVRREQRREEHQLAGEPDDRADADHARPVVVPVESGGRDRSCCRHGRHYVGSRAPGHPDPLSFRGPIVRERAGVRRPRPWVRPSRSSPSERVFTETVAGAGPVRPDRLGRGALPRSAWSCCAAGVTAGRSAGRSRFVVVGMGLLLRSRRSSGLAAYDTTLLSVHMVQHMVLSMLVPLALALGRAGHAGAAHAARPGRGAGCWPCLHSRVARVLSFPPLTFALYVVSPWALYFSGWYDASLELGLRPRDDARPPGAGRVRSSSGRWWASTRCPAGSGYPFRMLLVVLTLPFHAFLGVTIMGQQRADRRRLVPLAARGPDGRVAARPARRPAPRRRHPLGRPAT